MFVGALEPRLSCDGFTRAIRVIVAPRDRASGKFTRAVGPAGQDTLALGNITGSMVFQACFPTARD